MTTCLQRYHTRKAQGLCPNCAAPVSGYVKCPKCREYGSRHQRHLILQHRCRDCKSDIDQARVQQWCASCAAKRTWVHLGGRREDWDKVFSILQSQQFKCVYTGEALVLGENASIDHKKPVCRFPELSADVSNIQWVTRRVNFLKRDLTHEEFIAIVCKIAATVTAS